MKLAASKARHLRESSKETEIALRCLALNEHRELGANYFRDGTVGYRTWHAGKFSAFKFSEL